MKKFEFPYIKKINHVFLPQIFLTDFFPNGKPAAFEEWLNKISKAELIGWLINLVSFKRK